MGGRAGQAVAKPAASAVGSVSEGVDLATLQESTLFFIRCGATSIDHAKFRGECPGFALLGRGCRQCGRGQR